VILDALKALQTFGEIASLEESVFPLDRAALSLGLEEYPGLNIEDYLYRLDTLAARVDVLIGQDRSSASILGGLNEVLFVQEGLKGNKEDYYDPRNSFLNEVLDRKIGIPISLSVVFMEVARRIGCLIEGVGLPGHFLVKQTEGDRETVIDVFNRGKIVSLDDCQELLDQIYGGSVSIQPTFLQPMGKKAIVSRMLFNLKAIYYQREEYYKALAMVERILLLNPGTASEIRDRGLLYMQTSLFSKALSDLEYYLANTAAPEDRTSIESHIKTLRGIVGGHN
jgi:regulator of sirC expression with transglutaminase-like and TPR domain